MMIKYAGNLSSIIKESFPACIPNLFFKLYYSKRSEETCCKLGETLSVLMQYYLKESNYIQDIGCGRSLLKKLHHVQFVSLYYF